MTKHNNTNPPVSFDYIVVGAGAAGCVLASRLAQDGRYSVDLVEEGRKDSSRWINIPTTFFFGYAISRFNKYHIRARSEFG